MDKNDKNTIYNLVVQYQLGNYEVIDLNELNDSMALPRNNDINSSLMNIDSFTSKYTLKELARLVFESNMTTRDFTEEELRIVSNNKHNHSVMTKDVLENIQEFKNSKDTLDIITRGGLRTKDILRGKYNNIIDKKLSDNDESEYILKLNAFFGGDFKNVITASDDKKSILKKVFNNLLKNNNRLGIFLMIKCLPYEMARTLYFVINHDVKMRKIDSVDNTRNLKKVNDMA